MINHKCSGRKTIFLLFLIFSQTIHCLELDNSDSPHCGASSLSVNEEKIHVEEPLEERVELLTRHTESGSESQPQGESKGALKGLILPLWNKRLGPAARIARGPHGFGGSGDNGASLSMYQLTREFIIAEIFIVAFVIASIYFCYMIFEWAKELSPWMHPAVILTYIILNFDVLSKAFSIFSLTLGLYKKFLIIYTLHFEGHTRHRMLILFIARVFDMYFGWWTYFPFFDYMTIQTVWRSAFIKIHQYIASSMVLELIDDRKPVKLGRLKVLMGCGTLGSVVLLNDICAGFVIGNLTCKHVYFIWIYFVPYVLNVVLPWEEIKENVKGGKNLREVFTPRDIHLFALVFTGMMGLVIFV